MSKEARDIILLGMFFVAYGVLVAATSGLKLPTFRPPRVMVSGIDARRLKDAMLRRDQMVAQEHAESIEIEGVASNNPATD